METYAATSMPMMAMNPMQAMPTMMPEMHHPMFMNPQPMLSGEEQTAYNEVMQLVHLKKTSQDPRLETRIEQLLSQFPNLVSWIRTQVDK